MILEERLAIGIGTWRVELTKILAEGDQLRIGELLIVEDDDQPLAPYVVNCLDLLWRDRPRQIEPGNFCAKRRVEIFDRKRHGYSSVTRRNLRVPTLPTYRQTGASHSSSISCRAHRSKRAEGRTAGIRKRMRWTQVRMKRHSP